MYTVLGAGETWLAIVNLTCPWFTRTWIFIFCFCDLEKWVQQMTTLPETAGRPVRCRPSMTWVACASGVPSKRGSPSFDLRFRQLHRHCSSNLKARAAAIASARLTVGHLRNFVCIFILNIYMKYTVFFQTDHTDVQGDVQHWFSFLLTCHLMSHLPATWEVHQ